jgi:hypothetical protein
VKQEAELSLRRRLVIVGIVTISLVSIAAPALAHYVYQQTDYARIADVCYRARSEVSHGSKSPYDGYYKSSSWSLQDLVTPYGTIHCNTPVARAAQGYAAAIQKMKYNSATGVWAVCGASSGWYYSPTNGYNIEVIWDYGGYALPCGSGSYANYASATAKDPATGFWIKPGGKYFVLNSGSHTLPA